MKRTKNLGTLVVASAFLSGLCAMTMVTPANANPVLDLADRGVGYIMPTVIPPSGLDDTYLNNMIGVYNGTLSSPIAGENYTVDKGSSTPAHALPSSPALGPDITPSVADGYGSPTATVHLGTGGYEYLIAQWDGSNGADAVYYIAGLTGDITLENDLSGTFQNGHGPPQLQDQLGLSGYWLSSGGPPVPDGGMTVLLLGAALTGLWAVRRFARPATR